MTDTPHTRRRRRPRSPSPIAVTSSPLGLLDLQGATAALGLRSSRKVRDLARRGELPSYRIAHMLRFFAADIEQYIRSHAAFDADGTPRSETSGRVIRKPATFLPPQTTPRAADDDQ